MIALESIYAVLAGANLESLGLRSRLRTALGPNAKSGVVLKWSAYWGEPEVAGRRAKRRFLRGPRELASDKQAYRQQKDILPRV